MFPLFFILSQAHAYIFIGNPGTTISVDPAGGLTEAEATVDAIRVHKCGGGYTTFDIDETVDLIAGITIDIQPGDLCGVSVDWGSDVTFGTDAWSGTYDEPYTSVTLDGSPSTVSTALTPFEVTSGTFSGSPPRLVVTVE